MSDLYIKPFQDYLKQLCIEHKKLLHDDITNVVFIRFQTYQDIGSIPNNAGKFFVIMDNFVGRVIGEFDENRLRQEVSILFLKRSATGDGTPYLNIEATMQEALEILFDFYSRMKQDFYDDDCGPLQYIRPEQMTFEPVDGPVEEYHYGWLMNIPFDVNMPGYDPLKWNRQ